MRSEITLLCPTWGNNLHVNSSKIDQSHKQRYLLTFSVQILRWTHKFILQTTMWPAIVNFGPQKYVGRKILKFSGQISKFVYQILAGSARKYPLIIMCASYNYSENLKQKYWKISEITSYITFSGQSLKNWHVNCWLMLDPVSDRCIVLGWHYYWNPGFFAGAGIRCQSAHLRHSLLFFWLRTRNSQPHAQEDLLHYWPYVPPQMKCMILSFFKTFSMNLYCFSWHAIPCSWATLNHMV